MANRLIDELIINVKQRGAAATERQLQRIRDTLIDSAEGAELLREELDRIPQTLRQVERSADSATESLRSALSQDAGSEAIEASLEEISNSLFTLIDQTNDTNAALDRLTRESIQAMDRLADSIGADLERVEDGLIDVERQSRRTGDAMASAGRQGRRAGEGLNNAASGAAGVNRQGRGAVRTFSDLARVAGPIPQLYAVVAANIFAVSEALRILTQGEAVNRMEDIGNAITQDLGIPVTRVARQIQDATGFTVAYTDALQQATRGVGFGFTTDQLEALTLAARRASLALGIDVTDALDRAIRGTSKLEIEILDEIGVTTTLTRAYSNYATQLGISSDSLTEYQRRAALVNEINRQSEQRFGALTELARQGAPWEVFSANATEAFRQVTQGAAESTSGVAAFLNRISSAEDRAASPLREATSQAELNRQALATGRGIPLAIQETEQLISTQERALADAIALREQRQAAGVTRARLSTLFDTINGLTAGLSRLRATNEELRGSLGVSNRSVEGYAESIRNLQIASRGAESSLSILSAGTGDIAPDERAAGQIVALGEAYTLAANQAERLSLDTEARAAAEEELLRIIRATGVSSAAQLEVEVAGARELLNLRTQSRDVELERISTIAEGGDASQARRNALQQQINLLQSEADIILTRAGSASRLTELQQRQLNALVQQRLETEIALRDVDLEVITQSASILSNRVRTGDLRNDELAVARRTLQIESATLQASVQAEAEASAIETIKQRIAATNNRILDLEQSLADQAAQIGGSEESRLQVKDQILRRAFQEARTDEARLLASRRIRENEAEIARLRDRQNVASRLASTFRQQAGLPDTIAQQRELGRLNQQEGPLTEQDAARRDELRRQIETENITQAAQQANQSLSTLTAHTPGLQQVSTAILGIAASFDEMGNSSLTGAQQFTAGAQIIGGVLQNISAGQVTAINAQIAAERARDGQSAESQARIRQLEERRIREQRKAAIQQILISTAVGVANALATGTPPYNFVLAGLVGVAGAAALAQANSSADAQLAAIGQGGASESTNTLELGRRENRINTGISASRGELPFVRGDAGIGTSNSFTPRAAGGIGSPGMSFVAGESGPELITPLEPVRVSDASQTRQLRSSSGGGGTLAININAMDAQSVLDRAPEIFEALTIEADARGIDLTSIA